MSIRKQTVTAAVLGLVLAIGVVAGAVYFLPQSENHTNSNQVITSTLTSTITETVSPSTQSTQSSQSTQSASSQSASQSSQSKSTQQNEAGTVDVLLTDPPTLPTGVTAVYVTYSNVAVHVSGAGNQSGWTNANTTGTLNLVNLVNVSSTIATIKVTAGVYNELRFNISSAAVTYNGKNYTAFVQGALLTVPIPGGIPVNATTSSAAIIDMHPTVVNIGSDSTPEFIISTAASGYCVPQKSVTGSMGQQGNQINLGSSGWWQQISESYTANVSIGAATLKADSFSVTVTNTGSATINLTAIFVAPLGSECPVATPQTTTGSTSSTSSSQTSTSTTHSQTSTSGKGHQNPTVLPMCLTGSANFVVLDNGTILPISAALPISPRPMIGPTAVSWGLFGKTGYKLASGESVTLTYTGSITFGLGIVGAEAALIKSPGVIAGDQYEITVVGQQALAATIVVAS